MLLGVIADDFTGASDIANTLAKGQGAQSGLNTVQYLGVPEEAAGADAQAGVVSLKSRSIPADAAIAQSLAALEWLLEQGCRQIVFKYCSTFDSTPAGNIGPVGEALARRLGVTGVIACPAFPAAGRSLYNGHLFVGTVPLNESGMQHHPLNPMTDANLQRWLARQCKDPVGLVDWSTVSQGAAAIKSALHAASTQEQRLVVVDAITDADLIAIGEACADAALITGGSGIALGLPANFFKAGLAHGSRPVMAPQPGPEAILVGSCSRATLAQVEIHRREHPALDIDVAAVMSGDLDLPDIIGFILSNLGRAPLVYSSASPERVGQIQQAYGAGIVAARLDEMFGEIAQSLYASGIRRFVIGGGETSGAVISALRARSFHIGPEIDPGIPVLISADGLGLGVALKSGNFGSPNFFAKALNMLAGLAA